MLQDNSVFEVVRVEVAFSVPEALRARVVRVAQVHRHGAGVPPGPLQLVLAWAGWSMGKRAQEHG